MKFSSCLELKKSIQVFKPLLPVQILIIVFENFYLMDQQTDKATYRGSIACKRIFICFLLGQEIGSLIFKKMFMIKKEELIANCLDFKQESVQ